VGDADRVRWDARHAEHGLAVPGPPDALRGLEQHVPPAGRALDVACGRGGVAVWLALGGLAVEAVDVSVTGLAAGARLAAAHGVGERIRWIAHDLDLGLPGTGPYDVVVCQRFRDPARYPDLAAVLAPGGLLVITVLSEVGAGPGPFRAPPGELRAAFSGLDVLLDREGDGEATLLARSPVPRDSPRVPRPPS
jgi:SAM-dependent methyltransferase